MTEFVSVIGESFTNLDDAVKVILRIRPPIQGQEQDLNYFDIINSQQLNVRIPDGSWTYKNIKRTNSNLSYTFEFSNIYDWTSSQEKVFSGVVNSVVLDFISGRNSLLFTYGITNSGKTYTLIGKPKESGILPRTIDYLFSCIEKYTVGKQPLYKAVPHKGVIENDAQAVELEETFKQKLLKNHSKIFEDCHNINATDGDSFECNEINQDDIDNINFGVELLDIPNEINTTYYVYLSIAEIYNEYIYDLLDPFTNTDQKRVTLKVQGDQKNGFYVKNLKSVLVSNSLEALKILQIGLFHRKMAATKMNINSSRSHVLYSIRLVRCNELPNGQIATKSNEICFVDLAGAERQSSTLSEGNRLKEASNINKSLLFLGRCIEEMKQYRLNLNKNIVVSYRESKLTRLLQPFFVGRASMILFVNISPSIHVFDDTFNVLKFSALTKEALNRPMGVELQQAARTDAMLNDSESIDLSQCSVSELIQIINNMRRRILDLTKNSDFQASLIREEMSQFTMKMIQDLETEKDELITFERKMITESYLVKIDLLNDEINQLRSQLSKNTSTKETTSQEVINLKKQNEELKNLISKKEDLLNQLMADVDQFKSDSRNEITVLEKKFQEVTKALEVKSYDYAQLDLNFSKTKEQLESTKQQYDVQMSEMAKRKEEYETTVANFMKNEACLNECIEKIKQKSKADISNANSRIPKLIESVIPIKDSVFRIKDLICGMVETVNDTISDIKVNVVKMSDRNRLIDHKLNKVLSVFETSMEATFKSSNDFRSLFEINRQKSGDGQILCDSFGKIRTLKNSIKEYTKRVCEERRELKQSAQKLNEREEDYEKLEIMFNQLRVEHEILLHKHREVEELNSHNSKTLEETKEKLESTKAEILCLRKEIDQAKNNFKENHHSDSSSMTDRQAFLYENEIKSYKRLNEEYCQHICKLEEMLSLKNNQSVHVLNASNRLKRPRPDVALSENLDQQKKPKS